MTASRLQRLRSKASFSRERQLGQAGGSITSVESEAMRRAEQQSPLVRSIWALAVLSLIALLLVLSLAITTGAGHSFDQIALALPIFFVFLILATSIGDWLQVEDFFAEPKPRLSTALTRAPPA
jgi:choline-glycine betaine transporter